jgi:hypothetical protein
MAAPLTGIDPDRLHHAHLLAMRLERLSADSHWAHQASGLRGALLRSLDALERHSAFAQPDQAEVERMIPVLDQLIERGYYVLHQAARLIRTPDTSFFAPPH